VIWHNREKRQYHNVWFKELFSQEPQIFFPDESYRLDFYDAGEFWYSCGPHPKMRGLITVTIDNTNSIKFIPTQSVTGHSILGATI